MEEMDVKEREIQNLRAQINKRDSSLQKFVKLNGSMVLNPNEEAYNRFILQAYAKAQLLEEEKIALSSKSAALVSLSCTIHSLFMPHLNEKQMLALLPNHSIVFLVTDSTLLLLSLTAR